MANALVIGAVLELLLHVFPRPIKFVLVYASTAATIFGATGLVLYDPNGCTALLFLLSLYRVANLARVLAERINPMFLRFASLKASLVLIVSQLAVAGCYYAITYFSVPSSILWTIFAIGTFAAAVIVFLFTLRNLRKATFTPSKHHYPDSQLPSITVAVPARNETEILESNLRAIVASDYPKLEVIVLDDCSQNKRTPEIIRGFAQDGVRFLAGRPPAEGWLAKNQAYEQLGSEASGAYVVFMGVDVTIEPHTLRQLVTTMLAKQKTMMSLLPLRAIETSSHYSITQPMRYFWELAPPRRLFNRPPVLSSCWIIERAKLKKYGSFKAASNAIVPEAYFAKRSLQDNDGYTFAVSNPSLGLRSSKTAEAQHQTALRTRYPQLHRRLELVALLGLAEAATLLGPFCVLLVALIGVQLPLVVTSAALASALLLMASLALIAFRTRINPVLYAAATFPLVVLNDLFLLNYSLFKYEFSSVEWKGRNVCLPVLQVIPHLPKID